MKKKWVLALISTAAYLLYLITMAKLPGVMDQILGNWPIKLGHRFARSLKSPVLLYFCVAHMSLFGAAVPLYIAKKFGLKPHRKVSAAILYPSIAVLLGTFLFYANYHGFLNNMLNPNPDSAYMVEAFFYVFPFSLGLCIYSCFLIPRTVMFLLEGNKLSPILEAAADATTMWVSLQVYTLDAHILPEKIFWAAISIAVTGALSKSFYLSFIACFATLYGASMVNTVFYKIPWEPILPGFLGAFIAFCLYLHSRDTRTFPLAANKF